jgi:hypothetical protein
MINSCTDQSKFKSFNLNDHEKAAGQRAGVIISF